ncbi:hypothetical protein [Lentzea kentuckyensis]|uniref:hypothetical protein n=1 Tax=Lentzea kentuckyensis TaxID=360086 RepID=UPI000A3C2882|nr:hypothetical protein [Lentzea kentuckyensis]
MVEQLSPGKHIAILDHPANGRPLPTLAVVEEFARLGFRVTYVTTAEIASRFVLLGTTADAWTVVGILDEGAEPVATMRGYFSEDRPDLVVYRTNAQKTAAGVLETWRVPAVRMIAGPGGTEAAAFSGLFDVRVRDFLARHGLSLVPHDSSLDSYVQESGR